MKFGIERFLKVRGAFGPSVSPDSRRMVYLTDTAGHFQVWRVDLDNPVPEQVSFLDDRVTLARYSPNDDKIILAMDSGGDENMQFYLLDDQGVSCEQLTNRPDCMHVFGGFSPDGKRIAFSANTRHRRYFDAYVMDLGTREVRRVMENNIDGRIELHWLGNDALVGEIGESSSRQSLFHIDIISGTSRRIIDRGGEMRFGMIEPAPDSSKLYVTTSIDRDFLGLATLDLNGNLNYLTDHSWDIDGIALHPDGTKLVYSLNEDGYSVLHLLDLTTGADLPMPQLPRGMVGLAGVVMDSGLVWTPDGGKVLATFGGAAHNTDIWAIDIAGGTVTRITKSSTAGIPQSIFVEPELVRYPTFDGRQIPAYIYKPKSPAGARLPAIAWVHGGPESQSRPSWNAVIQYFVNRGYLVFVPNVRGSIGYGKAYTHLDDVRKRMDSVKDLEYGVNWLKARPDVDPAKVAVQGGSYGGFMVLSSITTYPDLFAAAIDFFGIGNWETFLLNTSPYRRKHREAEYGSLENDLEFLRSISPAHHVDKIRCPLLVIQGRKDPRVPFSESEQMVNRIRENGGIVEAIYFDDEGHGIVRMNNKMASWGGMADFLDRYLGGK